VSTLLASWFLEPVSSAAVDGGVPPVALALAPAQPNPASGESHLAFMLPHPGGARLVLLDVAGRCVRTLVDGPLAAGTHAVAWDGRDDHGARAPAGLYWARLEAGGETAVRRLVRVR
jgi:hypothetical protein